MREQKNETGTSLAGMSTRRLLSRRRALAARLGGAEQVLSGSLTEQTRRCGKAGCRCAGGEPHGPYAYFTARRQGRGRARYVPAEVAEVVVEKERRLAGACRRRHDARLGGVRARRGHPSTSSPSSAW